MATYIGIDIGTSGVRAVRVRSAYRRLAVEAMLETDRASAPSLVEAIRAAVKPLLSGGESIAIGFDGERTFVRRLSIPAAGQKQLTELVPFELEADLPFELEQAVFDHVVLRHASNQSIPLLAVVAQVEHVRERIGLVKEALGVEPERIVPGALALSGLSGVVPALAEDGPVLLLELDEQRTDALVLERGEPMFARTLSRGTAGLPESATALARELRHTLAAYRSAGGAALAAAYLVGPGATVPGAEAFLGAEIGLEVKQMPSADIPVEAPDGIGALVRFGKALSLAVALANRSRGLNLRQKVLAYEGGYGFLREKIPVLSGLGAVLVASFVFSALAESWSQDKERQVLEAALGSLTHEVLGEETTDPQRAAELIDKSIVGGEEDPMPRADAFDVMVQLAQAVPETLKHDVEEFDVQRGHVTIHGIVPTIPDAQQLATQLKSYRCFQDVKIVRTNQVVGEERQKYVLELDIKCPEEGKEAKDKAGAPASSASAAGAAGGKP